MDSRIASFKRPNFAEIHDALNELERIEYTPFSEEEL
jgi:hypothetical protein